MKSAKTVNISDLEFFNASEKLPVNWSAVVIKDGERYQVKRVDYIYEIVRCDVDKLVQKTPKNDIFGKRTYIDMESNFEPEIEWVGNVIDVDGLKYVATIRILPFEYIKSQDCLYFEWAYVENTNVVLI